MSKLAFYEYHNMVAILEKTEHNTDFHQIVDFLEASPLRYALLVRPTIYVSHIRQFWSTARIETADVETHIIAKINGKQVTVSESPIRRKLQLKDKEGICDLPDTDLFTNLSRMVPQGEGSVNPTEPHHTPSPQALFPQSQEPIPHKTTTLTSSQEPTSQQISTPSHTPTPRRLTKRAIRIAQSKALTPGADEPASPPRDDSHGEAFPTATSLDAGQDRENIPKTSAMPHESSPRVTSLGGDEGSLQLKLNELMDFCTKLQSQHSQMAAKIQRGMMDQREDFGIERDSNKSTDKGSESTGEMANVLSSMGAANILASGGLKEVFTTASPPVPPVSLFVPTVAATASEKDSTAAVITTTTAVTPYTRRTRASRGVVMTSSSPIPINIPSISKEDKGKGIMTEPAKPTKQKVQEQMSEQLARELEEEFA
ncbi:hypothetical protein Tco_1455815 [Tanacetum coccineum]